MLQSGKRELHLLPNISLLQPLLLKHSLKTRPQTVIQYFLSLVVYWLSSWQLDVSYDNDFRRITSSTNFEWPLSFRKLTSFITGKEEDCLIFCFLQYVFQGASLYPRLPLCCTYSCVVSRVMVWVTISMKQVEKLQEKFAWDTRENAFYGAISRHCTVMHHTFGLRI